MVLEVALTFQPRDYQIPIIKALNSGTKRAVWVVHRRGGKDLTAFNWCVLQLLLNPGWTAFHILPTYSQAKKVIWDSSTNDGQRILDYIPPEVIESKNGHEMKIRFTNGSLYQLIGSDNIDSLVGSNPKIIIFSEYAIQSPSAWAYLSPILEVNKGYAIFISTPRGKNHFYDLVNKAKSNPNWFCEVLSVKDTGVLSEEDLKNIQDDNGFSDEHMHQEYYCSFNRGVEGSYYGRLIEKARDEKRICNVPYDTRTPVHTAWDIGYGDSTSITFWQEVGGELRIIDFYEAQGEGIAHYAKVIQNKPYVYGTHYMPHDAGSGSIQTGRTLQAVAWEQGLKTTVLERETDISIGIEAVRSLLSVSYIDENKCKHLIKCLENYHKKYNEKTQAYSESPLHDWTSHAADSVRYMANARTQFGRGPGSLTPDKLKQLKTNAGYGPKAAPRLGPQSPFIGQNNDNPYSTRR
jgi:phage terminase large subunit